MDLSEFIFTSLGPILYNSIFITLWIAWLVYHTDSKEGRLKRLFNIYLTQNTIFYLITIITIILFLFLLFSYAIWNTDVDDAITSGVQAFLQGKNPYVDNVVVHHTPSGVILGRYHYFPPDLLTYSLFYVLAGSFFYPFLATYWFVPLHLGLVILGYWFVTQIVKWPHAKLAPFYLLLIIPFLFTNSILMWFFFTIGYYFHEIKQKKNLGMILYVFAASVKYMVGIIIVIYMIESIKEVIFLKDKKNNWKKGLELLSPYITSSLCLFLISFPFNVFEVFISVFIYQGVVGVREEVAQSVGPLLIEILKFFSLEMLYLFFVCFILFGTAIILRKKTSYEKIMHFSFLVMLILPFYATELFITIPFWWLFKEGYKSFNLNKALDD